MENKLKVLYIAGSGRSGSTILSNVLGELDGFVSVGEIYNIWQRGVIENRKCGCQKPFLECEFWHRVMDMAFGKSYRNCADQYIQFQKYYDNKKLLRKTLINKGKFFDVTDEYAKVLIDLYTAIHIASQSRVLVDSSKIPCHAAILNSISGIDLYILHIVRNPRAVVFSWMNKVPYEPDHQPSLFMDQYNPVLSSLIWLFWNSLIERLWAKSPRYFFLRYENFIKSPNLILEQIVNFLDESANHEVVFSDGSVILHSNHNVSGNPNRFVHGRVFLKSDDRWKSDLSSINGILTDLLTYSLRKKYGYQ